MKEEKTMLNLEENSGFNYEFRWKIEINFRKMLYRWNLKWEREREKKNKFIFGFNDGKKLSKISKDDILINRLFIIIFNLFFTVQQNKQEEEKEEKIKFSKINKS